MALTDDLSALMTARLIPLTASAIKDLSPGKTDAELGNALKALVDAGRVSRFLAYPVTAPHPIDAIITPGVGQALSYKLVPTTRPR